MSPETNKPQPDADAPSTPSNVPLSNQPPAPPAPSSTPTLPSSPAPAAPPTTSDQPLPGIVVGSDNPVPSQTVQPAQSQGNPTSTVPPFQPSSQPSPATSFSGGTPPKAGKILGRFSKRTQIIAVAAVVVFGGSAAAYFGYFNNPGVILSRGLSNTGKGSEKLIEYVDQQTKTKYKGAEGSGSYDFKGNGSTTDGSISFESDDKSARTKFDIGAGVTRVKAEILALTPPSGGNSPDIYLNFTGIKGLGEMTGSPELASAIDQLDGKWVVVDHTLIDNLAQSIDPESAQTQQPTREQIMSEAKAFNKVNREYLFTTKKDKAVIKEVKRFGKETVDGRKTYHYLMALDKENTKKYLTAQQNALKSSELGGWLKKNDYMKAVDDGFKDMQKAADDINKDDTFEMWVDTGKHMVYKVRFPEDKDPVNNYVDFGLKYDGGDKYPFFMAGKGKEGNVTTTGSILATLDAKSNSVALDLNLKTGADTEFTAKLNFKPSNKTLNIAPPPNPQQLMDVLRQLGLEEIFNSYLQTATSAAAQPGEAPGGLPISGQ